MTEAETRQMIQVLGDFLSPDMLDKSEAEIAEHLIMPCDKCGYQLSVMNRHLFSIIAHAKAKAGRLPEMVIG